MSAKKQVIIVVTAKTDQFTKQMDRLSRQMTDVGKKLEASGKQMTMRLTAPIVALGALSVRAFDKQAKAVAQVEAGLLSTGNAAGWTSEQLQKLAADLQTKTLFGDEDILQKSTAQLLTFTTIARDEFARAQEAALDLATRLDGDLQSATIMVGKALNDPIRGLAAMGKAGVQFTDTQKDLIKELWNTGRQAEAQRMILAELEKQYGGSAEAAAKAGAGGMVQLKNAISDLAEEFGKLVMENINPLVERVQRLVARLKEMDDSTKKNILSWAKLLAILGPFQFILGKLLVGLAGLMTSLKSVRILLLSTVKGVQVTTAGVTTLRGGIFGLTAAWKSLTAAMRANVIGIAITAVAIAVMKIKTALDAKKKATREASEADAEQLKQTHEQLAAVGALFAQLRQTVAGSKERKKIIDQINETYGTTAQNYADEKKALKEIDRLYNQVISTTIKQIKLEGSKKALVQSIEDEQMALINLGIAHAQFGAAAALGSVQANQAIKDAEERSRKAAASTTNLAKHVVGTQTELDKLLKPTGGSADKTEAETALAKIRKEVTELEDAIKNAILQGKSVDDLYEKLTPKKEALAKMEQQYNLLIGWDAALQKLKETVQDGVAIDIKIKDEDIEKVEMTLDNLPARFHRAVAASNALSEALRTLTTDAIAGFASALGEAIGGSASSFKNFLNSFIVHVADFAEQFGKYLIGLGIGIEAFQVSLATLNPVVAIAAGAALIATAAVIRQLMKDTSQGYALGTSFAPGGMAVVGERGPELINLPRGSQVIPNMRMNNMMGDMLPVVTIRGNDLQLVFDRNNKRQKRYR